MKRLLQNPWTSLISRLVLGAVFVYASIEKIQHPDLFADAIHNYRLIPIPFENLPALTLPWIELGFGIFLIVGFLTRSGALTLGSLLLLFIVAISINIIRGLDIACGCFTLTNEGRHLAWTTLIVDILLLLPAVQLLLFPKSALSADGVVPCRLERRPVGVDIEIPGGIERSFRRGEP